MSALLCYGIEFRYCEIEHLIEKYKYTCYEYELSQAVWESLGDDFIACSNSVNYDQSDIDYTYIIGKKINNEFSFSELNRINEKELCTHIKKVCEKHGLHYTFSRLITRISAWVW